MRGLLIKDISLITVNKKMLFIFLGISMMLLATGNGENTTFVVAYCTMLCGMLVLTTISYDEFDHSNAYLMTLPVTRKIYALGKYVFSALAMMIGWGFSTVVVFLLQMTVFHRQQGALEFWASCVSILLSMVLLLGVMIPIQLKFGGDNGRMVVLGFLAVVFFVVFGARLLFQYLQIDMEVFLENLSGQLSSLSPWFVGSILAVITLVWTSISMVVSIHIVEKKEF